MVKPLAAGFSLAIGKPSIKAIVQFYRNATRVSLAHTCFDRERSIRAVFPAATSAESVQGETEIIRDE